MTETVLYPTSVEPIFTDGRDIDTAVGGLIGEGADQEASGTVSKLMRQNAEVWRTLPEPDIADPTYYDRPMLNPPVWKWAIPTYYYVGGLTGAALVLGAAAQIGDSSAREELIRRCHWIGVIGASVSGALLIEDLGMPSRFINMLRVFRPTSVMNMGAWILTCTGGTALAALVFRRRKGLLGKIGYACGFAAGVFGAGLATYTGVLTGNTAVPLWQASRRVLPVLFGSSAMSSVGAFFELTTENPEERRLTRVFGTIGHAVELASSIAMEVKASAVPRVGRPFRRGLAGFLWRSAMVLTASGLALGLLNKPRKAAAVSSTPPKEPASSFAVLRRACVPLALLPKRGSRNRELAAGIISTAGSALMRVSVEHLGDASARDARASFHQQRAGYGAAEITQPRATL